MESIFFRSLRFVKRTIWAIIVAYMLGMHNFYKGEDKTPDDLGVIIEANEVQEDGAPKKTDKFNT